MRWIWLSIVGLWSLTAQAHPFSQEEYSLRTMVQVSEKGIRPLVVLEVPIPIALREIGATTDDPRDVKKRKINKYNQSQWDALSAGLTFTVDGQKCQGSWLALEHEANGKAAEGFFIYMVGFRFDKAPELKADSIIEINNLSFADAPMVYSGSAYASDGWKVASSTALDILQEHATAELSDPKRWSKDAAMRKMTIQLTKQ